MSHSIDRRRFVAGTSAFLGGMFAGSTPYSSAEEPALTSKQLVLSGLNALARAPEMNYFTDGHRGASMISAHLMCVDNAFDDMAAARIVELFNLNWAGTKLCQPFPDGEPVVNATEQIGKTLAEGGDVLRQVGHDAIFAMHAIKAFRMLPEAATKERVDGVCRLIKAFTPWRDEKPDDSIRPPRFSDSKAAARFILKEASNAIDRFRGFGQGFAGHMLTFGQSLVEMAAMGDEEWAESCRIAFCKYVTVTRKGPQPGDRKIKDHAFSKLRPDQSKYWKNRGDKSVGIGHVFKYPYAYYDLLTRADDADLSAELDAKAWELF